MSCGYQGHEFGSSYDSLCIDGLLWDADSGDGDGLLTCGGDIACPKCNTAAFLEGALSEAKDGGCGLSGFMPYVAMAGWEAAVAKARRENPSEAEQFLCAVAPFKTDDWPDREAVFASPSLWRETVEREWRYTAPGPQAIAGRSS